MSNRRDEFTAQERKDRPLYRGVFAYFPDALLEVARVSKAGNDQHNPGQPIHWAKEKSTDHADCIGRHLLDHGTLDNDGQRHSAKLAWRALALLQIELEVEAAKGGRQEKVKLVEGLMKQAEDDLYTRIAQLGAEPLPSVEEQILSLEDALRRHASAQGDGDGGSKTHFEGSVPSVLICRDPKCHCHVRGR